MALSGALLLLGTANHKVEAATNTPNIYIVKAGDTLWGISHKYGVSLNKIEALNNKSSLIYVGDQIKLTGAYTYTAPVVQTKVNYNASTQAGNQAASQSSTQSSYNQSVAANNATAKSTTTVSTAQTQTQSQAATTQTAATTSAKSYTSNATGSEASAKAWIAGHESGGSYSAVNPSTGAYGKYQLLPQYLHGDYSPANQERVADQYVAQRYNGWIGAQQHWQAYRWY